MGIASRAAFVTTIAARRAASFSSTPLYWGQALRSRPQIARRFMSSFGGDPPEISQIGKEQMEEILEDLDEGGREESGYVVLDVRGEDEIAYTGKLSPNVHTIPLPLIVQKNAFAMEEDDFEESFGFEKPGLDETLVFTCKAGIRSQQAAGIASMSGYSNLVNYIGGANEWFGPF